MRQPANTDALKRDRLPPHSEEAEKGLLGCLLIDPIRIIYCRANLKAGRSVFYIEHHKYIYDAVLSLAKDTDIITLSTKLKEQGVLESCGGVAYLSSLMDSTPSAANLEYYVGIVSEYHRRREHIRFFTDCVAYCYEYEEDFSNLESEMAREYKRIQDTAKASSRRMVWGIDDLLDYNTDSDPNAILGMTLDGKTSRYLCKGYGCWIIGPSGIGKSTLTYQLIYALITGNSFYGVKPVCEQRVLLIQAENDQGDNAEMMKGIAEAFGIDIFSDEATYKKFQENFRVVTERRTTGTEFCNFLRNEIIDFAATTVIVDPVLSFAGIDPTNIKEVSDFLRHGINPVLEDTGALAFFIHHTGKPDQKKEKDAKISPTEFAYKGIGSSELVNWARAAIVLWPMIEENTYQLVFAKRGERAMAQHPDESITSIVYLRHGIGKVLWEQIPPPVEPEGGDDEKPARGSRPPNLIQQVVTSNLYSFYQQIPADGELAASIKARLMDHVSRPDMETPYDINSAQAVKCITEMVKRKKLVKRGGKFFKGENA